MTHPHPDPTTVVLYSTFECPALSVGLSRCQHGNMKQLTPLSYHLWTAQIQVNGITVILSQESCLDKHFRVIGTKLKKTQKSFRPWSVPA
jgi:hypothetical protein